jgi:hypothetical protein
MNDAARELFVFRRRQGRHRICPILLLRPWQ